MNLYICIYEPKKLFFFLYICFVVKWIEDFLFFWIKVQTKMYDSFCSSHKKKNLSRYKNVPEIFIFPLCYMYVHYIFYGLCYIFYKTYKNKMTLKTKKLSHKNITGHIANRDFLFFLLIPEKTNGCNIFFCFKDEKLNDFSVTTSN